MNTKVLVLGSGGREHALAWRLSRDEFVEKVFVAPGNGGMEEEKIELVSLKGSKEICHFCQQNKISLVVIGPEGPLVEGMVDELTQQDILAYGPSKEAAQLEGSKVFAKEFMNKHQIPTAPYEVYHSYREALEEIEKWDIAQGVAIKADCLAGGKGVVVTTELATAKEALYDFLENPQCSVKSRSVVVEKKLSGRELSWFALCDGKNFISLGGVCDYKRLKEGDHGPNTGGMGAYTVGDSWPSREIIKTIEEKVIAPVLANMEYRGTLFAGLMIHGDEVNVLEFNVRFGDPETQAILPLVEGNLTQTLINCATGTGGGEITLSSKRAVHVVMASKGYPSIHGEALDTGHPILFPRKVPASSKIFLAGVKKSGEKLLNSGGRVLGVTGVGDNVAVAREMAYEVINGISFHGANWRRDIAT